MAQVTLSSSARNLLSQALVTAVDAYVGFAVDASLMGNGARLQAQFLQQATEARKFAILIGEGDSAVTISNCWLSDAERDTVAITNQQFADTLASRKSETE